MSTTVLNAMGLKCPRPLFEVSKKMKTIPEGERLEVHADDPAFKADIEAWCRRMKHEIVEFRKEDDRQVAVLEKKG